MRIGKYLSYQFIHFTLKYFQYSVGRSLCHKSSERERERENVLKVYKKDQFLCISIQSKDSYCKEMLPRKITLFGGLLLLLFVSLIQCAENSEGEGDETEGFQAFARQNVSRSTTKMPRSTRRPLTTTTTNYYPHVPYEPKEDKYPKKNDRYGKNRYGGRYDNNYDGSDEYDNSRYEVIGRDGVHPGEYGQDVGDFGPVYSDQEDMYASMTVWIRAADDWESTRNRKKYGGSKYNKNKDYNDKNYNKKKDYKDKNYQDSDYKKSSNKGGNDYKKNDRNKRSYSRVEFPVRQYKDVRKFPHRNFPPLISIFPWLPIFYDKITYQTIIFSPTGGIYILPPLINFYGHRFAVAQLIKWGYASLVSSGAPPPPNVNVAPLVQPVPAAGPVPAGVAGGASAQPAPTYDSKKNRFVGGVKTDFPDFKPRYSQTIEERGGRYGNDRSVNQNAYGGGSNYGGTGRQEVYARGGPQTGDVNYGGTGRQEVYPRGGPQSGGANN
ncbi:hypothetical protein I4U23_026281 [Adineta vaga]|nr:hypothetical protein I4U23_026281 [Adineta vaga]